MKYSISSTSLPLTFSKFMYFLLSQLNEKSISYDFRHYLQDHPFMKELIYLRHVIFRLQDFMSLKNQKFNNTFDFFQESDQGYNLNFQNFSPFHRELSRLISQDDKQPEIQRKSEQKSKSRSGLSKADKSNKIRTSRNVQKTYHNILKHWLQNQGYETVLPKYNQFFNQRVYFILALDEITKKIDGEMFATSYQQLAREVIAKKQAQILILSKKKVNTEQSNHLKRVIEEIEFSIKACKQFVVGNVLDSLKTVYKRNKEKITKIKEFQKAVKTYTQITGHEPQNF